MTNQDGSIYYPYPNVSGGGISWGDYYPSGAAGGHYSSDYDNAYSYKLNITLKSGYRYVFGPYAKDGYILDTSRSSSFTGFDFTYNGSSSSIPSVPSTLTYYFTPTNVNLTYNIYTQNENGAFEQSTAGGTTTFWYRDSGMHDHTETWTSSTGTQYARAYNGYGYSISASANSGYKVLLKSDTGSNPMYSGSVTKTVNIYYGLTKYWTSYASISFGGGDGTTEAKAYEISTPEQLAKLALDVNDGEAYTGKYFKQTADLDMGGHNWKPIGVFFNPYGGGNENTWFTGTYNGNNYTISGIDCHDDSGAGLFYFAKGAVLENINIRDSLFVGASAASILCTDFMGTSIKNCSSNAVVQGTSAAGGIVNSCSNTTLSSCTFTGSITSSGSSSYAGGIAGSTYTSTVEECKNYGSVTSTGDTSSVGGIVGNMQMTEISRCISSGLIVGKNKLGAIAGGFGSTATITDCATYGTLNGQNLTNTGVLVGAVNNSGGSTIVVQNCSFKGNSNLDLKKIVAVTDVTNVTFNINESYFQVNTNKYYYAGDFSDFTVVPNMNGDLPMQNALFSVAIGGQTSEYVINYLKSKGFQAIS